MLGDVTFSTEGIVVISTLVVALTGAVVFMFRQLKESQEARLTQLNDTWEARITALEARFTAVQSQRDSYQEMLFDAMTALEARVNMTRKAEGKPKFVTMAPVVPEHGSPVTQEQQDAAEMQTIRARLTAAVLELGLPPREAEEIEPGVVSTPSPEERGLVPGHGEQDPTVEPKTIEPTSLPITLPALEPGEQYKVDVVPAPEPPTPDIPTLD